MGRVGVVQTMGWGVAHPWPVAAGRSTTQCIPFMLRLASLQLEGDFWPGRLSLGHLGAGAATLPRPTVQAPDWAGLCRSQEWAGSWLRLLVVWLLP